MIFARAAAAFVCIAVAAANPAKQQAKYLSGFYNPSNNNSNEALTVALDVVQAWAIVLTMGFILVMFFFLGFCVCSKKDDGYDEFEITQGITAVKICHDGGENGVSLIPRINGSGGTLSMKATDETSEASSRYTLKRELPAIPTSSHDNIQGGSKLVGGVQVIPAGAMAPGGRAAVVKDNSISSPEGDQSDVRKDRKTKGEHPYAKVSHESSEESYDSKLISQEKRKKENEARYQSIQQSSMLVKDSSTTRYQLTQKQQSLQKESVTGIKPATAQSFPDQSTKLGGATMATSVHSTISSTSISTSTPSAPIDIPASMAISGRQRANEEMPYMTPSILQAGQQQEQPQHFSGDSQDSRGYTSISVREPLAALKARQMAEGITTRGGVPSAGKAKTGVPSALGPDGEGYYMTVEDDSADEMYACIYEGSRGGTGSETYAQIEPRTTPPSDQPPPSSVQSSGAAVSGSPTKMSRSQEQSPPAPPSVDSLRHVVHSRQASASSATSTGMGSPIAEKRGTRSPLPPLPQGDVSLYSQPDPPVISSQSVPKSPPKATSQFAEKTSPRALEEMYAKVNKKSGHSRGNSAGGESEGATSPTKPKVDLTKSMIETRSHDVSSGSRAKSCEMSWGGISTKEGMPQRMSGNYETIPSQGNSMYSGSDPGYETVKNDEAPYASVGYETVRGSDMDSEPGYETVSEVTSKKRSQTSEAGYESVSKRDSSSDFEPGYETVTSKGTSDPGYESVTDKRKSDYDPGYEELAHPSHLRTSSETDPNYEQLKFTSSRTSSEGGDYGYEVLKKETVEGNYEQISDYDTQMKDKDVFTGPPSKDLPLYASVKKKESPKKEEAVICEGLIDFGPPSSQQPVKREEKKERPISAGKDLQSEIDDLLGDLGKTSEKKVIGTTTTTGLEDLLGGFSTDSNFTVKESKPKDYEVMDSPEDVELPPPGEEEPSTEQKEKKITPPPSPQPAISLSFTSASPVTSDTSSSSSKAESSIKAAAAKEQPRKTESSGSEDICPAPPPSEFESCPPGSGHCNEETPKSGFHSCLPGSGHCNEEPLTSEFDPCPPGSGHCNEESPLPPPPLPTLDDELATASPPPPPPPLLDDFTLPPPNQQSENGSISLIDGSISTEGIELPPPPCGDVEPSLEGSMNGGITVTINPMAQLEETRPEPVTVQTPLIVPVGSSIPTSNFGSSVESPITSVNGSGGVESIVTVDAKTGATPATTVPTTAVQVPTLQHSSSDSKHSDASSEAITPV